MADSERVAFTAGDADAGRRLDQVLAARVPGLSRRRARLLLDIGGVFVGGRRTKLAGRAVRAGEEIVAHLGGALERATSRLGRSARAADEQRLPGLTVVFEDEDLIVVEKPAGMLAAPTPESDRNNVASVLARREDGSSRPVLIVHRLDLETSGLMVLARSRLANRVLAERFRTHDLGRVYLAVVGGAFPAGVAVIDRPVGGRPAITRVTVEERLGARATVVRCTLETGRTHQIRLHALSLGHPVLGDPQYGVTPPGLSPPRMALHATGLSFVHPRLGTELAFESAWPTDIRGWLERLRGAS